MLRLRMLAKEHAEVNELLPPPELDVPKLRRFAEDEIEARFERVRGVSQSNVIGGLEDELQVVIDPEKLAARQLTITDVRNVLRGQNEDTSGGDYWEGKRRWVVRTLGQFRTPEHVEQQLLAVRDGNPVYVRDVAEVRLGYKKPDGLVRRFGESSIAVNVLRETGANVLDVMDGLQAVNAQLNDGILEPAGLQLTQVYDETEYIDSSISLVQQNIFIGGALTMIVLMVFLHLGLRTLLVAPLILATAISAAYVSPWFFAVTLGHHLGGGFLVRPRRPGRGPGHSHQHHRDIPGPGLPGTVAECDQPGRPGVRRGDAGRQRGRRAGKHLSALGRGEAPLSAAVRGTHGSLGRRAVVDAHHGRRVPADRFCAGRGGPAVS